VKSAGKKEPHVVCRLLFARAVRLAATVLLLSLGSNCAGIQTTRADVEKTKEAAARIGERRISRDVLL